MWRIICTPESTRRRWWIKWRSKTELHSIDSLKDNLPSLLLMFFPPYSATRPPLSPTHLPDVFITTLSATTTAFHDMCNAACAEMSAYHCSSAWKPSCHSSVLGLNRFFVLSWLAPSFLLNGMPMFLLWLIWEVFLQKRKMLRKRNASVGTGENKHREKEKNDFVMMVLYIFPWMASVGDRLVN